MTDHTFTGQKRDGTGLLYYNARSYDPEIGTFVSPDTIVPDPSLLIDYNRYAYTRGNPLKYTDPTGHTACAALAPAPPLAIGCQLGELAMRYGPLVVNQVSMWADKVPAAADWLFSKPANEQQAQDLTNLSQASDSASGGNPNGFDPNDPWNSFRNRGMAEHSVRSLQEAARKGIDPAKAFQQYDALRNKGIDLTGHALQEAQRESISSFYRNL